MGPADRVDLFGCVDPGAFGDDVDRWRRGRDVDLAEPFDGRGIGLDERDHHACQVRCRLFEGGELRPVRVEQSLDLGVVEEPGEVGVDEDDAGDARVGGGDERRDEPAVRVRHEHDRGGEAVSVELAT